MKNKLKLKAAVFAVFLVIVCGVFGYLALNSAKEAGDESAYLKSLDWNMELTDSYESLKNSIDTAGGFDAWDGKSTYVLSNSGDVLNFYEDGFPLGEGFYTFADGKSLGVKNADGEIAIPARYKGFTLFHEGMVIALDDVGRKYILSNKGNELYRMTSSHDMRWIGDKMYAIDGPEKVEIFNASTGETKLAEYDGKPILDMNYTGDGGYVLELGIEEFPYEENVLVENDGKVTADLDTNVRVGRKGEGKRFIGDGKYINEKGEIAVQFEESANLANIFSEGMAIIYGSDALFAIDEQGKTVFSLDYIDVKSKMKSPFRTITPDGLNRNFDEFLQLETWFSCGVAPVTVDRKHFGYINKAGEFVIEPIFEQAGVPTADGTAAVTYRGKTGILNVAKIKGVK